MYLTDLNRDGGIGANSLLLEIGPFRILVDAGMHPKKLGKEALPDFSQLDRDGLDAIILTHCHLDHVGALPVIARSHPQAPIITTIPNLTLAPRMLRNSINVMKRQRAEHNIPEYPLFVHRELGQMSGRFEGQAFGKTEHYRSGKETFSVTLHAAGHVAGAAAVEIQYRQQRIILTGDVLFEAMTTLPGAKLPEDSADLLVLETTRGLTERPPEASREAETKRLFARLNAVLGHGGSCLIPVFALGRMQEMLVVLAQARRDGLLQKSPVFITGLGVDLASMFNKIARRSNALDFDIEVIEELGAVPPDPNLVPGRNPAKRGIYLVSSGMLVEHTPSYQVAASLLAHPENGIFFIGYCDPDSPGGKLLETQPEERFFFEVYDYSTPVRAEIGQFDLSGHADREELVEYAVRLKPKNIVLTHGDPEARTWFMETLQKRLPDCSLYDPKPLMRHAIAL